MMEKTKQSDQALYRASREYFHALRRAEQVTAIRGMAAQGMGDHTIAHATELTVELVRQVLTSCVVGDVHPTFQKMPLIGNHAATPVSSAVTNQHSESTSPASKNGKD